jgi:hypothetical protein
MSNPGVIILDSCKKSIFQKILNRNSFRYFQIEDNIGESIHLHFDDFRIELSISDFFEVCDAIKEALNNLVNLENFDSYKIDPLFLKYASKHLHDLIEIEIVEIDHDNTRFILNNNRFKLPFLKKFKAITANDLFEINKEPRKYKFFNVKNNKDYFINSQDDTFKPIVDENYIIRDGKHRLFIKYQTKEKAKAYLWKFRNNSFKINFIKHYLIIITRRIIMVIKNKIKKLAQIFNNLIEKVFN